MLLQSSETNMISNKISGTKFSWNIIYDCGYRWRLRDKYQWLVLQFLIFLPFYKLRTYIASISQNEVSNKDILSLSRCSRN